MPAAANLNGTLPELQTAEARLRGVAQAKGITYNVADYGGLRTPADTSKLIMWRDQAVTAAVNGAKALAVKLNLAPADTSAQIEAAKKKAYYRVAPYDATYHGAGAAFDIRVTGVPAGMSVDQAYKYLGSQAPRLGMRWGGLFSAPADPFHFELAISLAEAKARYKQFVATGSSSGFSTTPPAAGSPPAAPLAPAKPIVKMDIPALLAVGVLGGLWFVVRQQRRAH